ncbi:MAG TPA: prepilin peptidase [Bacteroidetes bacterium]|nr:prepilin peptidase [Bacteroidota bacterium]
MFIIGVLFFVFGLIFGSFLNVCIYRLPRGESIVWPASHCPVCKAEIKPWDNVPVLSFIALCGKCRSCKAKIHRRYPLVEMLTGILFAGLFLKFGLTGEVITFLFLAALLVVITFIDIEYQLILNKITLPGLLLGAILTWQLGSVHLWQIGLGLVIGGGSLVLVALLGKGLFGKESMGMGDVKMAAMIGVFIGAKGVAISLFLGFLIAGIFSFVGMATKKVNRSSYIPFGPFIAGGTLVYIFWGENIITWYLMYAGLK